MQHQVRYYVDYLFRSAAKTARNEELHQKILQNAMDRYADLTAEGVEPEEAFRQVQAAIGDISHLIDPAPAAEQAAQSAPVQQPVQPRKKHTGLWIALGCVAALAALLIPLAVSILQLTAKPSHYRNDESIVAQMEDALEDAAEEQIESSVDNALQWAEDAAAAPILSSSIAIQYDNTQAYTIGPVQVSASGIQKISVEWPIGLVQVQYHDGEDILATESESELVMRWQLDGNVLDIRFCEPCRNTIAQAKTLTLLLPHSLQTALEIDAISAEIEIRDVSLRSLDCETISGNVRLSAVTLDNDLHFESVSGALTADASCLGLEAETISGSIVFSGTLRRTELETTTGDFVLNLSETPDLVEFESTSGSLDMTIPGERSFTAAMETVSGKLRSQLALSGPDRLRTYTGENTNPAAFTFETISGDVKIRK